MGRFIDLTGKKFGRLFVVDSINKTNNGTYLWRCQCDCGNIVEVRTNNLNNKSTISCGCFKNEYLISKNRRNNLFDLSNEYGIGYTNTGETFLFDLDDHEKIRNYCWSFDNGNHLRAAKNHKRISFSRFVMSAPDDLVVDHINGKTFDNRKSNLRLCTTTQNNWNTDTERKNNTSGQIGVYWDKRIDRWFARITCDKKIYYLGYYKNFDDAKNARINAEKLYFGEYRRRESYDNS